VGSQVTDEPGSTTWFELYSSDAKRARDFYTAVLGATADPMPGGPEYYVLKHGGKVMGPIDDSPFGRIAALMDPGGAFFKIVQPPMG
jgi:predicted enzyme related to lactoylglutathione lyase